MAKNKKYPVIEGESSRDRSLRLKREWWARDYANDPQKYLDRNKKQYQENPEPARQREKKRVEKIKKETPEKLKRDTRDSRLKHLYGISLEEYNAMLEEQQYVCKICRRPNSRNHPLSVDHCHRTGKVRALLCVKCNVGLGSLDDSIERLEEALLYLREYE
jgi:hypothetical protein